MLVVVLYIIVRKESIVRNNKEEEESSGLKRAMALSQRILLEKENFFFSLSLVII